MKDLKNENVETRFIEDRAATQKDFKILKLELLNQLHIDKSYLMTRLGTMIVAGFTILGILGWMK